MVDCTKMFHVKHFLKQFLQNQVKYIDIINKKCYNVICRKKEKRKQIVKLCEKIMLF